MDYKRFDNKIVLRLKKGEKIIESLEKLANEANISAAHFQGIGAVNELKIGLMKPGDDDYTWDNSQGKFRNNFINRQYNNF
ncbi:PCC domain-containing protein [Anaerococcus cruorum]|uniref:PCC domain-containing protein n=1 Tax=Anaerococcus sp. WGS1596 TaxID=3366806 RepID=UPI00372D015F